MHKEISHICDNLYLTSFASAKLFYTNTPQASSKVTSILISKELAPHCLELPCDNLICLPIDDIETEDIFKQIPHVLDILEKSQPCLIFCMKGISRSASFCIAYIMKKRGLSYEDSFAFVKSKRNIICPNRGFVEQLKKYERYLRRQ